VAPQSSASISTAELNPTMFEAPPLPQTGPELWDVIREANALLRRTTDLDARVELSWRRAAAWEQLTLLAVDGGAAPWYAAACACIADRSTQAAEYAEARRRPRLP
jgi:hypothetical protein